jgi:hypothetical protein
MKLDSLPVVGLFLLGVSCGKERGRADGGKGSIGTTTGTAFSTTRNGIRTTNGTGNGGYAVKGRKK